MRLRAIRFSSQENELLIAGVLEHYAYLFGNRAAKTSKAAKVQLWKGIADTITRHSGIPRTWEQVSHRYRDVKAQLKGKIATRRKYQQQTGGGAPCPTVITQMEQRLLDRLGLDVFEGLEPRLDTSQVATARFQECPGPSQELPGPSWQGPSVSQPIPVIQRPLQLDAEMQMQQEELIPSQESPPFTGLNVSLDIDTFMQDTAGWRARTSSPMYSSGTPPEAPPAAALDRPMTTLHGLRLGVEIRFLRRVMQRQNRILQHGIASSSQDASTIAAAVTTMTNVLSHILERMPYQTLESSHWRQPPTAVQAGDKDTGVSPPKQCHLQEARAHVAKGP
ncbi:myb-related transcription factor, partner of profilin-like [Rhinatrema bivittatum]|uniref:myb-related transcription factor, partner of profilin-like n=1 Tax=Rhinatrema bivittatum TaxID=194408 RepID=UPI0011278F32|nr:myb-related transcription factor, partner of profilin-like [Rhinatrema bivittatum]